MGDLSHRFRFEDGFIASWSQVLSNVEVI